MLVHKHIILGGIFSLFLYLLFPQIGLPGASLIFLSSVLIDVDHYFYYVGKNKTINPKTAYNWFYSNYLKRKKFSREQRNKLKNNFLAFHGLEFLFFIFSLSLIFKNFFFVLTGLSFHLFLDILHQKTYQDRIDKVSLIYDTIKSKKLEDW